MKRTPYRYANMDEKRSRSIALQIAKQLSEEAMMNTKIVEISKLCFKYLIQSFLRI